MKMHHSVLNKYFAAIIASFFSVLVYFPVFSQLHKIVDNRGIYNYAVSNLQEKIYVHTDRSYYLCGEIVWFKAYVVNAADNRLLSVSKVIYVELVNSNHEPVLQAKIDAKDAIGSGSFKLPPLLSSGNYELRAYTNWMKNGPPEGYFKKIITVINTTQNPDTSITKNHIEYYANFFPEGGNLVAGLPCTIGFKVNDNRGMGVDCSGIILDQSNDTVASFHPLKFGMGKFLLTPQNGNHYKAVITFADKSVIETNLPEVNSSGYVMHLSEEGKDRILVSVQSAGIHTGQAVANMYLIAQTGQYIDAAESQNFRNDQIVFVINKDSLKEGLARLTLFNEAQQPVCERLYFKYPAKKMLIDAKPDKQTYPERSKVTIDVSTSNRSGNTIPGNLSAAVYRLDGLHELPHADIFTYLWLSSDLKGYIEDPDYYFENDDANSRDALDNLLLTQGWRKFDGSPLFENKKSFFTYVPENAGHIISGRVTNEITGKPAANILVYLSVPGKRIQLYGCRSNESGIVHFDMKDFFGASQIVLQTNAATDSAYHLEIFNPFSEKSSNEIFPALHVAIKDRDDLQTENLHMRIENGYYATNLQTLQEPIIDSLPFFYKPDKIYMLDDYTRFTTMEEVMREYVAEVNVTRKDKNYHFNTLNLPGVALKEMQPVEILFTNDPLVLLDGVPVFDINKIIAYDPLKVQRLAVVARRFYDGPIVADGIVSYTTYKGNLEGYTLDPRDLILDYDGLQQQRIFYSPDYSSDEERTSRLPDFRDLLYWSPAIATDGKTGSHLSFYTGDFPGKYVVVLQGISPGGDAGSSTFTITVTK